MINTYVSYLHELFLKIKIEDTMSDIINRLLLLLCVLFMLFMGIDMIARGVPCSIKKWLRRMFSCLMNAFIVFMYLCWLDCFRDPQLQWFPLMILAQCYVIKIMIRNICNDRIVFKKRTILVAYGRGVEKRP